MADFNVPIPRSRGLGGPNILSIGPMAVPAPTPTPNADLAAIRDMIIYAGIGRVAYQDDRTEEIVTEYTESTGIVDIDISDELLQEIEKVTIGPNFERYLSWLTNGISNLRQETVSFTIGGGGSAITAGLKGVGLQMGYNAVIRKVTVFADVSGSVSIDIWKDTPANYPPTVVDTIVGGNPATIVSALSNSDVNLTGWNTDLNCDDILLYNVNSATDITFLTITLHVIRDYLGS